MSTLHSIGRLRRQILRFPYIFGHDMFIHQAQYHHGRLSVQTRRSLTTETVKDVDQAPFLYNNCVYCNPHYLHKRFKSKSASKTKISDEHDSDDTDIDELLEETESEEDVTEFPQETDRNLPTHYLDRTVHTVRADQIVGDCLTKTKTAAVQLFYEGKLRHNNKVLLKKALKVKENDVLDVVHKEEEDKLQVTRVKVLKLYSEQTRSGKHKMAVRVWKKQFYIDKIQNR